MQIGICGTPDQMPFLRDSGADYLEANVRTLTEPQKADGEFVLPTGNPLPTAAANSFVPAELRLAGPDVDVERQNAYLDRVLTRCAAMNVRMIVFGSGGARNIPAGFERHDAWNQLSDFAARASQRAAAHKITIVIEPLNRGESNVINNLAEAARLVDAVHLPNFQLLLDSYHFWLEDDSLDELRRLLPMIRHVHVADKIGRAYPGESGEADYGPMFSLLKRAGYDDCISIEAAAPASPEVVPRSIDYLRRAWREA